VIWKFRSLFAAERDPLHQGIIVERAKLRPRDYQVDLASNLKKSQVQSASMGLSQQGGYYCEVCDCVLKDSLAYLDHINGKYHNRALGMSMEVERSTADQVRKRLELAKKKKSGEIPEEADYFPEGVNQKLLEYNNSKEEDSETEDSEGGSENDEEDEESNFAAMMGFGSFGGSKKNQ
jgi:U4/U6.U5 tri-snRNP component SNU23